MNYGFDGLDMVRGSKRKFNSRIYLVAILNILTVCVLGGLSLVAKFPFILGMAPVLFLINFFGLRKNPRLWVYKYSYRLETTPYTSKLVVTLSELLNNYSDELKYFINPPQILFDEAWNNISTWNVAGNSSYDDISKYNSKLIKMKEQCAAKRVELQGKAVSSDVIDSGLTMTEV